MSRIGDVAREAGVSTATVSRALRGRPGVSALTRDRVQEAASRLGYTASPHASGLAGGRTGTVAVITAYHSRWFFAAALHGVEEVLRRAGFDLLLYNLAGTPAHRRRVFGTGLLVKRVDAVLVLGLRPTAAELEALVALDRPLAFVSTAVAGQRSVRVDDAAGARAATEHLTGLGHRRIALVGGPGAFDPTAHLDRRAGHRAALEAAGLGPDPDLEEDGGFTAAGGLEAGRRLLTSARPPTAVFAASDEMAFGVLAAAAEVGADVPGDLSVVGYDDHELAASAGLTTVAQPVRAQGRAAARLVVAAVDALARGEVSAPEQPERPEQLVLPTRLVVRRSTAPPR